MSNIQKMIGILGFVVVWGSGIQKASADCPTFPTGFTCKCNGDDTRWVCAKWGGPVPPVLNLDFTVSYTGNTPRVEFIKADDGWELYSEVLVAGVPTGPADLGDLLLASDVSPNNGNFKVKIRNGTAAGAVDVKSLVLDSTDVSWTGHSSILSGTVIDGVINGALKVIERSGAGGEIDGLTVNGPGGLGSVAVVGPIDARRVTGTNLIDGDVTNKITIAILDGVSLTIDGAISGGLEVTTKVEEALLVVNGTVPAGKVVTIADMIGQAQANASLRFGGLFAGDLILTNGIDDAHAVVGLTGDFTGTIDLTNSDIAGQLNLVNGDGDVLNGGSILSGAIFYPSQFEADPPNSYDGTATFTSVAAGAEIESKQGAEIGGTIHVTGDMAGEVAVASGRLKSGGKIQIDGAMSGEVHIGLDCAGDIEIGVDASGDIKVDGDLTSTGSVTVVGALANAGLGGGRIMIAGESSGDIKVGKQTQSLTLIQVAGGLATGSSIEINTTEGNFNAEGDIQIGLPDIMMLTPITFDGCIRIYDHLGTIPPEGGSLRGDLTVTGCHATDADLNICIDGDDNGNVFIVQGGCTNQVGWSCNTCP